MRNDPYRHSVWLDIFGVLIVGGVLLGGATYLLSHTGGAGGGLGITTSQQGGNPMAARKPGSPGARRAPTAGGGLSLPGPTPIAEGRRAPGGDASVPFSEGWQGEAEPDLTGPSSPSGGGVQRGGGLGTDDSDPALADRHPTGETGGGNVRGGGQARSDAVSQDWRAEARQLSGQARALSNQLRQLDRSNSQESREKTSSEDASGQASTAAASGNDRDPGNPPSVPIDDHLHWLVVVGLLWGIWRLS